MSTEPTPTLKQWEEAVRRSYKASVHVDGQDDDAPDSEYSLKATDRNVYLVAYYLMGTLGLGELDLLDDTPGEWPNTTVQVLMDFLAFTEGV